MTREYTKRLLQMVEDGLLDRDKLLMACVNYMSESDVQDMMEDNDMLGEDWEDEDDGQPTEQEEWASFDADA